MASRPVQSGYDPVRDTTVVAPVRYDGAPDDGSAWVEGDTQLRVFRGGSWYHPAEVCRSAARGRWILLIRQDDLGFRPAISVP